MSSQQALTRGFVEASGHQIAYLDSGAGEQTLLLVHGNPVSSHVYVPLIERLPDRYRCVAPDLLGFGVSDKPGDETAYTLTRHLSIITEFVRTLDLRDITLVAHDWGGPIGLGAALGDKRRYTHLVLLNTLTDVPMSIPLRYRIPFHVLLRVDRLADYLMKERNLFQKIAVSDMAESDQGVYLRANDSPATRAGIAAFPRMIPHNREHPNYSLLRTILTELKSWDIPALVLFSDGDNIFSVEQGKQLTERIQNARFELVAGAGHFLQYERPDKVASAIDDFLREEQ